jgi:hypothetical protein
MKKPVAMALASFGAILALAPLASASPADDQFLREVQYSVRMPMNPGVVQSLLIMGRAACSILDQGYNSTDAMNATVRGYQGKVFGIGFMLAATRAYCPQYSYMYSNL